MTNHPNYPGPSNKQTSLRWKWPKMASWNQPRRANRLEVNSQQKLNYCPIRWSNALIGRHCDKAERRRVHECLCMCMCSALGTTPAERDHTLDYRGDESKFQVTAISAF